MRASAAVSIAALVAAVMAVPELPRQDGEAGDGQDAGWDADTDLLAAANDNDTRVSQFGDRVVESIARRADGSVGAGEG